MPLVRRIQHIIDLVEVGEELILAVIYLGKELPRYVLKNLRYLRDTFPEYNTYFISDSKLSLQEASKVGVMTWLAPNPDEHWKEVRRNLSHEMSFRKGFWFKTLARIFVLNSFMQVHTNEPCLQIEADVFLFPNFPIAKFRSLDAEIAFPMESSQMGIASLLFLRNHRAAETLMNFAIDQTLIDSKTTDMSLLGLIANTKLLRFAPLRTLPIELQSALTQPEAVHLVCEDSLDDHGVFDGITLGQYLLGIDPRNSRGTRILFQRQHSHAINPEKLSFTLDADKNLWIENPYGNSPVYNLHNHAKDIRVYKTSSRNKLLKNRIKAAKKGEKREFMMRIFIKSAVKAVRRRAINGIKR